MEQDISEILRDWEYNPEDNIRIIHAADGRKLLQVRQPLGIEQYEMEGRPDGKRPFGKQTVLMEFEERLEQWKSAHDQDDSGFILSSGDFHLLQNEGILMYFRYLHLFQISDFERTARDTEHNLKICQLSEKYCEDKEEAKAILQYKPYILRINAVANAMLSLQKNVKNLARKIIQQAINQINEMEDVDSPAFKLEKARSLSYLKSALEQFSEEEPSEVERLKMDLKQAVEEEDYERAARLRDTIKTLTGFDQ
jgi:hypothetical protein